MVDESQLVDGYVDLQVNGYLGVDFNDPTIEPAQIVKAAEAMRADGVAAALPTVITGSLEAMCQCIGNLRTAMESDEVVASVFQGIHIEGPFLSKVPGFIGAHPVRHALECDPHALERLLEAAGEWTRIVTLAPEIDAKGELTRLCVERGINVAAGHTDATLDQLASCIDAGLNLFTHLGNGCPKLMDRHDNIIYRGLRFRDQISYSLVADGFHIPQVLFENLLDWVPAERLLVVSDAIAAAGLGPGTYRLGDREVKIGPDKAARDASGEHFVGAASSMRDADTWLANTLRLNHSRRQQLLVGNPARFLAKRQSPIS